MIKKKKKKKTPPRSTLPSSPEPVTVQPYCLAELLEMKPGALLGGFVKVNDRWRLAPEWQLPNGIKNRKSFPFAPFSEYGVRWRQKFFSTSEKVARSRVYKPSMELLTDSMMVVESTLQLNFQVGSPVGIYLGHIIRCNGVTWVNFLTGEGFDCWC